MNLIFWRNVLSVIFLVAFVLDLIFGNGVGKWWDWLIGAILVNASANLVSRFEEYHGKRKIYKFDGNSVSDVLNILIVVLLFIRVVFGSPINWLDFLVGAGFAFAVRNLAMTFQNKSRR